MKIIYAFSFFVSMLFYSVFPCFLFGQNNTTFPIGKTPYTISLESGLGVLLGQSEEIVYKYSDKDKDDYLSELLWDLKPMMYFGTTLNLSRTNPLDGLGAVADLSVKFGLPILSGTMEDRDWYDRPYSSGYDDPRLSNFSSHDAYIQGAILVDFSIGLSIPIGSVALKPLVSLSFMRFSWIARNGYTEYGRDAWEKKYMQGTGISYDQNWLILSPGIGLIWPVLPVMRLEMDLFISPLIFYSDMDIHLTTKTEYHDAMQCGFYLEPSLDFVFFPGRNLSLVVHGSWRHITGLRGDTEAITIGSSGGIPGTSVGQAGAAYSAFDLGLILKIRLGR
jgi:outer membrane protease